MSAKHGRYGQTVTTDPVGVSNFWCQSVSGCGSRIKGHFIRYAHSSSSHMRVMNDNWSATKQHLHPQSVAEISRHSVLSGDRIRQCGICSFTAGRQCNGLGGVCAL